MDNDNSVQLFCGVRGLERDGVAYLHIEDVARGLGFTQIAASGNACVRWERIDRHLSELDFIPTSGDGQNPHDYYIPENVFYRLCMKAKNAVAEAFQAKVADEIIPAIRKTGVYATDNFIERTLNDPDWAISVLQAVKHEREQRELAEAQCKLAEAQRNEAIRTKTHFVEGRDAEMCGRVGGLTRENNVLKDAVGRGRNWQTVSMMSSEWVRRFGHKPDWRKLKEFSAEVAIAPIRDVEEKIVHANGVEKVVKSYRYHKDAWERYERYEKMLGVYG